MRKQQAEEQASSATADIKHESDSKPLNDSSVQHGANSKKRKREEEQEKAVVKKEETEAPVDPSTVTAAPSASSYGDDSSGDSSDDDDDDMEDDAAVKREVESSESDSDSDSDASIKIEPDSDANSNLTSDEEEENLTVVKQESSDPSASASSDAPSTSSSSSSRPALTPSQLELRRLLYELSQLTPAQRKAIPKNNPLSKRNIRRLGKEDREIRRVQREERILRKRAKRRAKSKWLEVCKEAKAKNLPEPPRSEFPPKPIRVKVRLDKGAYEAITKAPSSSSSSVPSVTPSALAPLESAKSRYSGKSDVVIVPAAKKQKVDPRTALVDKVKSKDRELAELAHQLLGRPLPVPKPEPERDQFGFLLPGEKAAKKKPEDRKVDNISNKRLANKMKEQKAEERRIKKLARRLERKKVEEEEIAAGIRPPPEVTGPVKKGSRRKEAKRLAREAKEKKAAEMKEKRENWIKTKEEAKVQQTDPAADHLLASSVNETMSPSD